MLGCSFDDTTKPLTVKGRRGITLLGAKARCVTFAFGRWGVYVTFCYFL